MAFPIFYAWQMDCDPKLNRWFIDRALADAIKLLNKEFSTSDDVKLDEAPGIEEGEVNQADPDPEPDDDKIVMQWGASGEPGAKIIGEVILDRITKCGIFVGDVSFVTQINVRGREKFLPNANVLIELGAAAKTGDSWNRIVLVMNEHFGSVEQLPFDLRHRSCKVTYKLADMGDPNKAQIRKQLANDLAKEIRPMYRNVLKARAIAKTLAAPDISESKWLEDAERRRIEFEQRVISGNFHSIAAKRCIFAVSVMPSEPRPKLTLREPAIQSNKNLPLIYGGSAGYFHSETHRIIRTDVEATKSRYQATEIWNNGNIFAARHMLGLEGDVDNRSSAFIQYQMPGIERHIGRAVFAYSKLLRSLGFTGKIAFGLSLLKSANTKLLAGDPDNPLNFDINEYTAVATQADSVRTDLHIIPDDFSMTLRDFMRNIRPTLDQFWMGYGYKQGADTFNETGEYKVNIQEDRN